MVWMARYVIIPWNQREHEHKVPYGWSEALCSVPFYHLAFALSHASMADGSLVSRNRVPALPRPTRKSSSMYDVSNQPLSVVPRTFARIANNQPRLITNPLFSVISQVSNVTTARLSTLSDTRYLPPTTTLPKSRSTLLVTRLCTTSNICFVSLLDVSTLRPAALTAPLLLYALLGTEPPSVKSSTLYTSSPCAMEYGAVYLRYHVPSRNCIAVASSVSSLGGMGVFVAFVSSCRTKLSTFCCVSIDASLPLLVNDAASQSSCFVCERILLLPPPTTLRPAIAFWNGLGMSNAVTGRDARINANANGNSRSIVTCRLVVFVIVGVVVIVSTSSCTVWSRWIFYNTSYGDCRNVLL
mmetsp:Transcript_13016/g.35913  ORF Transcript_13016/g.35913 Transcript_13016/m.35913 type:complete len:355 (-) Transcript_13016:50-1114(-)